MGSIVDILLYNVVAFLAVLTVIVAVHEAGHFIVARLCRVRVITFSIGFGPELFGWNGRNGTRYKVSLLPLGGYVRMAGGLMPDGPEAQESGGFPSRPVWQRALIILAGPMANFIFAFLILFAMALNFGSATLPPKIGGFTENSAAADTALAVGDEIVMVNGRSTETFGDVARVMALHTGGPIDLQAQRPDGSRFTVSITPNEQYIDSATGPVRVFRLGIRATDELETQSYGIFGAAAAAVENQVQISSMVFQGLGQVVTGNRSVTELEGPVGMSQHVAEASRTSIWTVLQMMIFLNMIIGLMNLLPIPVLDGGHLVFLAYEAVFRRPLPNRVMEVALMIGLGLIVAQFVFVTFQDLLPNRTMIPGWLPRF
ncbi:MAG: RIP metalloprotease RseP [Geminicoccus sp.]|nr:RIP metalloprotease RseP [Geminicoccus sp.]